MGTVKTAYHTVAALVILHLLAITGALGYWFANGTLDVERVREAVAVLKEDRTDPLEDDGEARTSDDQSPEPTALSPEEQRTNDEIAWRNAERYRTQIEQRLKLVNAARLDVDRRREELERLRKQAQAQQQERAESQSAAGYEKQIEILSSLTPKVALQQFMTMSDADAALVLFRLETRKVKKIVEAAKNQAQQAKMTTVLQLMRDLKPDGYDDAGRSGATPTP